MSTQEKKSNKKQLIILGISLCFMAGAFTYRHYKIEAMKALPTEYSGTVSVEQVFKDELKVMHAIAGEFDQIVKDDNLNPDGTAVMELIEKWKYIKNHKKSFSMEELTAATKANKEVTKVAITRLQYSSLPISITDAGKKLMKQVGEELGVTAKPSDTKQVSTK